MVFQAAENGVDEAKEELEKLSEQNVIEAKEALEELNQHKTINFLKKITPTHLFSEINRLILSPIL